MSDDNKNPDKPAWQRTPPHQDPRFRNFRHPAMKTYGREYVLQNPERFGIDLEAWAAEHGEPEDGDTPGGH
jgi:hypothetical protein